VALKNLCFKAPCNVVMAKYEIGPGTSIARCILCATGTPPVSIRKIGTGMRNVLACSLRMLRIGMTGD